jgi:hypothetical protein
MSFTANHWFTPVEIEAIPETRFIFSAVRFGDPLLNWCFFTVRPSLIYPRLKVYTCILCNRYVAFDPSETSLACVCHFDHHEPVQIVPHDDDIVDIR